MSAEPSAPAADRGGQGAVGRLRLRFAPDGVEVRVPAGTPIFDAASWNGIAIDSTSHPELRDDHVGNYRRVVWLAQHPTPATRVGDGGLERALERLLAVPAAAGR